MNASLDFTDPRFWLDVAQMVAIAALWLRKPGEDATARVGKLEGQLQVIEERIRHMPTADELTELEGTVKSIAAQLDAMQDNVKNTRAAVQRIEDFLRNNR